MSKKIKHLDYVEKNLLLLGESHDDAEEMTFFEEVIGAVNPSYVLVEALGNLKLTNARDKKKALELRPEGLEQLEATKSWIETANKFKMPFIGLKEVGVRSHEPKTKSHKEKEFLDTIESYRTGLHGERLRVVAVVNDLSLTTVYTKEYGYRSLLQEKYEDDPEVIIIRSTKG